MAWLQRDPSDNYHICFRYGGRKFKRSLKTKDETTASSRKARLEENIQLVESGRIELLENVDIPTFLLSDGKLKGKTKLQSVLTLKGLFESFFENLPNGNLEQNTIDCMQIHHRHFVRHLGSSFPVQHLILADLQSYVGKRSKEKGRRGRTVGANTINKEIVTFRCVWNWGVDMGKLQGEFPKKGLRLPKITELPPFQTWEEIEQQISAEELSENQQADLWDSLFLNLDQIEELLTYVQQNATQPFVYPMVVMAAHTGARRSELLRSQCKDFNGQSLLIHERKRVKGKKTTRRVPLSSKLRRVIDAWFAKHSGGSHTFCQSEVTRSKKKRQTPQPITCDEASDHFKRSLKGSKWETIKGWHCLRHSFISNMACKGIDQRIIDGFVGHTTEAMRQRYTHLFPSTQQQALRMVFG